jgi:branched-subunit amino acid transport protein
MTGMAQLSLWLTLMLAGLLTFVMRLSFVGLFHRLGMVAGLRRALRLAPPAVLAALIFPELLMPDGQLDVSLVNARLIAGLVAAVVAWRTRNVLATIVVGMITLILWSAIMS